MEKEITMEKTLKNIFTTEWLLLCDGRKPKVEKNEFSKVIDEMKKNTIDSLQMEEFKNFKNLRSANENKNYAITATVHFESYFMKPVNIPMIEELEIELKDVYERDFDLYEKKEAGKSEFTVFYVAGYSLGELFNVLNPFLERIWNYINSIDSKFKYEFHVEEV